MDDYRFKPVAVHEFRAALRRARAARGITSRAVSEELGFSHSVVSTWETGRRVPTADQLNLFFDHLDIHGEERAHILDLARKATSPSPVNLIPGMPDDLSEVISCEQEACAIEEWSPSTVPDLLQTSVYTESLWAEQGRDAREVESRRLMQAGRREILTRRAAPVRYTAVIGAAVLREPVASPAVMVEQIDFLVSQACGPNVTIRVIPMFAGWHLGLNGPFSLYHFPSGQKSVRHGHAGTSCFVTGPNVEYRAAVDEMLRKALDVSASIDALKDAANEWRNLHIADEAAMRAKSISAYRVRHGTADVSRMRGETS